MKKLLLILSVFSFFTFISCSEDDSNDIGNTSYLFLSTTTNLPVFEGQVSSVDVKVGVTTKSDVDRVFSIEVDMDESTATPDQYSIPTTEVTIPAGSYSSTFKIFGNYDQLPVDETRTVVLKIKDGVGAVGGKSVNTVSLFRACATNAVTLTFNFDGYASEIGWQLVKNPSTTIASVNPTTYADGLTTFSQEFCLEAGTYTFNVADTYGDGLSFPANGNYSLVHSDGTVLVTGGGNFGSFATHTFTLN